ncbi:diguanylate cyclase [Paenibacillus sp. FSL R7-0273]|uniref:NAD(P)H-dependent flavin oxidoreductase n=1 Tax=Paenibacillus sp. FSL R7-0273 TaxID=1536772 RepID=UPI0004F75084|nr:nitronate monooxygenase [Paenibacillus sp. FSL R7-0273]AIQ48662.1 diguanylate cyclase [Paenibacillus sp. FSL R7-0273]OMF93994.1 diguanylate cyclase [Paenibacillus sp. FSL R7-0273]
MKNRVADILGIEKPILQGPMSWITNAEFVAAVSNAGGLGILGPNAGQTTITTSPEETAERMRREIRKTKELTDKPFGTTLIVGGDLTYTWPILEIVIAEGVKVVLLNGVEGTLTEKIITPLKEAGIKIVYRPLNPTFEDAKAAQAKGVDVYVVTGFDEGGTLPSSAIGTFTITPMIVDVLDIPVIAAGGIGDARGVASAFALGAEGVFLGSRFIPTVECPAAQSVKQMIVDSTAADLLFYRTLPAYYRSLPTPFAEKLMAMDKQGASREEISRFEGGSSALRIGMLEGNGEGGIISVGTGITSIKKIQTVQEVVEELAAGIK